MAEEPRSGPVGGAEATLKLLDYIEDEAQSIQHSIWMNRPYKALRKLRKLDKDTAYLEDQVLALYRALKSLEGSLSGLQDMSEGDQNALHFTDRGLEFLRDGNWGAASDSIEKAVAALGPDGLSRSLSVLKRHLNELGELSDTEHVALTLVSQASISLENDEMSAAAESFEKAISALGPVAATQASSPFMVNRFFMSIGTTWPEDLGHGLMVITLENLGENNIAPMRLDPAIPFGWACTPRMTEIPEIPPEGFIEIGVEINPSGQFPQTSLLGTSLNITTGYYVDFGELNVQARVENRTPRKMEGLLVDPWLPEGFETVRLPLIENLGPGAVVQVPVEVLNINKVVGAA